MYSFVKKVVVISELQRVPVCLQEETLKWNCIAGSSRWSLHGCWQQAGHCPDRSGPVGGVWYSRPRDPASATAVRVRHDRHTVMLAPFVSGRQWIHQLAAPCNVIRGSGMTCHWICPVAALCNVTRISGIMTLNSPGGSTLQCGRCLWDDIPLNSPKRPPYWNSTSCSISTISLQSTCQSAPVCEILSKSDHPQQKKMTSCRFSRWRTSAILDYRFPIMGSFKSPYKTSYRSAIETIALNCLVFEKITFFIFWQQTNRWTASMH